ncbi:MAG: AI-2E family transporter [Holosporales bacterium]
MKRDIQFSIKWVLWAGILALIYALFYMLSGIMAPFMVGILIAYAMSDPMRRLTSLGFSRSSAAGLLVLGFLVVISWGLVTAFPFLESQLGYIAQHLPRYADKLSESSQPLLNFLSSTFPKEDWAQAREMVSSYFNDMIAMSFRSLAGLITNSLALANILLLTIMTPLIAFFMLRDWPQFLHGLERLLPPQTTPRMKRLGQDTHHVLAGFLRGQFLVCLITGVLYAAGLKTIGLEHAITLGMLSGLFSFIPFLGFTIALLVAMSLAAFQFQTWSAVGLVAGIYGFIHAIEVYYLTPRLIGERIGLHPVWVLFSLLACGAVFGFWGLFLSLPLAAVIGVMVRHALEIYRDSALYAHESPKAHKEVR